MLVAGWHGQFLAGHARILKELIGQITIPVLLVKAAARMPFQLKVGEQEQ